MNSKDIKVFLGSQRYRGLNHVSVCNTCLFVYACAHVCVGFNKVWIMMDGP